MKLSVKVAALIALSQALNPALVSAAEPPSKRVTITYQDLTGTQPPATSAWVSHAEGIHLWTLGKPASLGIKRLSEEGNPEFVLGTALFDKEHAYLDEAAGVATFPGHGRTITLSVDAAHPRVSGGWMLGMTNDGFTGVDAIEAYSLKAPITVEIYALDAGTRRNSEKQPHTAALGGLEEDPPENGVVTRHPGIRGDADIPASFKFDPTKPVGRVTISPAGQPAG